MYKPMTCITEADFFKDGSGVALYKFNGNARDAGGQYNGTENDITYDTGKFGQAAVFNGSSSNIKIQDITVTNDYSISLWLKTTSINDSRVFEFATDNGRQILGCSDGSGIFGFQCNSSSTYGVDSSTIEDGEWHHIIATSATDFYIDGNKITTTTDKAAWGEANNPLLFGAYSNGGQYLNGSIDQIRIFNRALTSDEVQQLYNES